MSADSTIRVPSDLLDRASRLDPENRSEILRKACLIGIERMEKEKIFESAAETESLMANLLKTSQILNDQINNMVQKKLLSVDRTDLRVRKLKIPFVRNGSDNPFLSLKQGEVAELQIPEMNWMVYSPVNLVIRCFPEKLPARGTRGTPAPIEVSRFCTDGGSGRDLLMPGWHSARDFGTPTVFAKEEHICAPNRPTLLVRANEKVQMASVTMIANVVRDDAFGKIPDGSPFDMERVSQGRRIRIPFQKARDQRGQTHETAPVNWGVLKVEGLLFREDLDGDKVFYTTFSDLRLGGSPNIAPSMEKNLAADYLDLDHSLRANPILISPNRASISLSSDPAIPELVCSVIKDHGP